MESEKRIAVVGGDAGRAPELPPRMDVRWFPSARDGGTARAKRVLSAIAHGGIDVVVLLVRWLGHPLARAVRRACGRADVRVIIVRGGYSALRRTLVDLGEV